MGQRLGSMIGAIGGMIFILVNAGVLSYPVSLAIRTAGVLTFAWVIWYADIRTRNWQVGTGPTAAAMQVYWICVSAEVLAIVLGAQLLVCVLHQPDLTLAWVVLVVGLHFLPFARVFRAPLFAILGAALIAVALIGGLIAVTLNPDGGRWAGIAAGILLLAFAALGPRSESL